MAGHLIEDVGEKWSQHTENHQERRKRNKMFYLPLPLCTDLIGIFHWLKPTASHGAWETIEQNIHGSLRLQGKVVKIESFGGANRKYPAHRNCVSLKKRKDILCLGHTIERTASESRILRTWPKLESEVTRHRVNHPSREAH